MSLCTYHVTFFYISNIAHPHNECHSSTYQVNFVHMSNVSRQHNMHHSSTRQMSFFTHHVTFIHMSKIIRPCVKMFWKHCHLWKNVFISEFDGNIMITKLRKTQPEEVKDFFWCSKTQKLYISEMTRMWQSQIENVKDFFWCYKIEILVHVLERIKREKVFQEVEIINVNACRNRKNRENKR